MYNTDMITNVTTEVNEYKRGNWIDMINPTESEIFKYRARIYKVFTRL